jgi:hypothetical protein
MKRMLTEKRAAKLAAASGKTLSGHEEAKLDQAVNKAMWKSAITGRG